VRSAALSPRFALAPEGPTPYALRAVEARRPVSSVGGSGPTGTTPTITLQRGYEAAQIGVFRAALRVVAGHIYRGLKARALEAPAPATAPAEAERRLSDGHTSRASTGLPVTAAPRGHGQGRVAARGI